MLLVVPTLLGVCVAAQHTATFVATKPGFLHDGAGEWTGEIHVVDIGVPRRLLDEFADVRQKSLGELGTVRVADLDRRGLHPDFGPVTLRQLLATWVAHDLDHLTQIVRVMARQYTDEVGPWRQYLRIIRDAPG